MPIPHCRILRLSVYWLLVSGLLLTAQLSFGYSVWLSASKWSVNFGGLRAGATATMPEVLTNTGHHTLTLESASLSRPEFTLRGPALPLRLHPGESVTMEVIFAPKARANYSANLAIPWGLHGRVLNVPLVGTGTGAGSISAVPASLSFGSVAVGSSLVKAATLSATGATAVLSSVNTTNPEFTISGVTLPLTVGVGQKVPFTVKFSPQSAGSASARLSFLSSGSGSVAAQTLSGSGMAPANHSVSLSWQASSSAVAGYNIYRGTVSGGPYSKINPSVDSGNAYTDANVQSGKKYFYVLTAVNRAGAESGYSKEANAAVPSP